MNNAIKDMLDLYNQYQEELKQGKTTKTLEEWRIDAQAKKMADPTSETGHRKDMLIDAYRHYLTGGKMGNLHYFCNCGALKTSNPNCHSDWCGVNEARDLWVFGAL